MSCSKLLQPFVCDSLYYLNRDQLERFSIVCRPLKNFIERYLHTKPYRIFDGLWIHGGSYALVHGYTQWHPNRDDYSVQQFLDHSPCYDGDEYYSFAEMRPYLGPTIRINYTGIFIAGGIIYNPEHIEQMESIAYLWRGGNIDIRNAEEHARQFGAEDFQPILNSPTILQCKNLHMINAHFSFKDYKVLYAVKVIEIRYTDKGNNELRLQYWQQFLEQPGVKPVVVFLYLRREYIDNFLDRISKAFSSAVSPNAFKIVLPKKGRPLTEFRETNTISGEILELFTTEYQTVIFGKDYYTLKRTTI